MSTLNEDIDKLGKTALHIKDQLTEACRLLTCVREEMELADFDPEDTDTVYGQICQFLDGAQ